MGYIIIMTSDERTWLDLYKAYKANPLPSREDIQVRYGKYCPKPFLDELVFVMYWIYQEFGKPDAINYYEELLKNEPL